MISLRLQLIARPAKRRELAQALAALKEEIAAEPGCLGCRVYQDTELQDEFIVLEDWESEALAQQHLSSEYFAILCGAGAVLAGNACISLYSYPSIKTLEEMFCKRVEKEAFKV